MTAVLDHVQVKVTREELVAAWEQFKDAVAKWRSSDSEALITNFHGVTVKMLSQAVLNEFDELWSLAKRDDIEIGGWELALAIEEFHAKVSKWALELANPSKDVSPTGSREMWFAFDQIDDALIVRPQRNVESVQQLAALEGMMPANIAKIYGWYSVDGSPDVSKVAEELANPGKHTKDWVDPQVMRRMAQLQSRWESRTASRAQPIGSITKIKGERPVKQSKPAPEPIDELLRLPGITIQQVAKMKQCTIEEVRAVASDLRIIIDPSILDDIRRASADDIPGLQRMIDQQAMNDVAAINTYPALDSMEDRIDALLDDGFKPAVIATALKPHYPAISYTVICQRLANRDQNEQPHERTDTTDRSNRPAKGKKPANKTAQPEGDPATL